LFFSEYVEGLSNNKGVEIYNGSDGAVNLSTLSIQIYFNGSATVGNTIALPSVFLAPGDVYVVANNLAAFAGSADLTSASLNFNGDDAVVLTQAGSRIDVIGQIGLDPGTEWGTGNTSTADNTIRRNSNVCVGDANGVDVFDPSTEWTGFATDTFDGLGAHSATCPEGVPGASGWTLTAIGVLMLGGATLALGRRTTPAI